MRKSILLGAVLLVASCTVQKEEEFKSPSQHRYHAVAEEPVDAETRVYADSKLRVRWNEGDHISIFERNTYNQEFEFLGDTGDTAGDFDPVESSGYHSSGDIEDGHVYAVYPYHNRNKCDFDGTLTVTFPSVQHYKKDSFGVGANVMVAKTNTLDLRFMHVGGYRTFKLYGEGVSVSSVRIESNGSEFLAGRTEVVIGSDGKPEVSFVESTSNSNSVELVCDTPVALGGSADEAVEFWFVLPPGTLSQGFTVTVTDENGNEFTKSTSNSIEIKSGVKKSMPAFEVEMEDEPAGSDTEFNEDAYITYVANHESWFLGGNQYVNDTYFTGATGTRFEMKFQIPSYTSMSEVTLASESGERYNDAFKVTRNNVFYRAETRDDQIDTDLTSNDIDGTSVIVLSASCNGSQVTAAVNGNEKTVSLALSSFDLGFLFSSYYHDNDEGSYTAYSAGVPDGAKLYYVKIWDGDDLVYFGHAASATCPYSSNIEHCWYEEVSQTYTFARELTMPSNAEPGYGNATVRQPFGGGVDVDVPVTGITLNKTSIAFTAAGETDQLTATVAPSDATISTVTWSSSDNTVATVRSDGTVTAVGDGAATIIATANDGSGVTAECKVTMGNIVFADENVKSICVANWDTNGDGELSYVEAAAVASTAIGTVFKSNKDITSFDEFRFFSGLTSIVASAFSGCSGLTSIIIPDSVTHIGSQAFSGCSGLSSLILNEGLQALFTSAFSGCSGLTSIIIPDSVTSIGSSAFFGCSGLTSINIPDGVTSIESQTFYVCSGLTSISIPDGVTSIGKSAFYNCSGLTSINIPDGVTSIESQTFYGCSGLSSLILNEGLQRINSSAFENCSSLKEVIFPSTITQLSGAFYASGIETIECYLNLLDEGLRTTSGLVLSKLSSAFFKNNTTTKESVKTIIIKKPNGTTTYPLPDYAFEGFSGAESISLPDGLTTIGYSAFKDCSSLLEAPVKESVTSIGPLAFYKCGGLTSIIIPDGVTSIGSQAFSGCSGLTSISVPAGVTSIGSQVFSGCSGLTSISIPDGVTSIGMGAFSGCSGLTSINIPDGVTSIGSSAFYGCSGLTSINIPAGVTSIESSAFSGCSGLTSINIPADVTSIGMQAFSGCSGLTSINIPAGVTGIGESAFYGCSGLTSINIPAGVTSIESSSFYGCSGLTSITIPAGVTSIGWRAFYGCGGLTAITCLPTGCPTAGNNIFDGSDCPIYVPFESVDAYKTAQNWSLYASRIQAIQ